MFLTHGGDEDVFVKNVTGRNPLKSGQCFLLEQTFKVGDIVKICRNPLKSGQCFLHADENRTHPDLIEGRNPLKSGQCFLHGRIMENGKGR